MVEVPMALQLGWKHIFRRRSAIGNALLPDFPNGLTVSERILARETLTIVLADLALATSAIPNSHFVNIPLIVVLVVGKINREE